jgi:hypothetical protein
MKQSRFCSLSLVAGVAVLAGVLTACRSPEGPYVVVAAPDSPEAAGAEVVILNYDLSKRLAVDHPPTVTRNQKGQLEVQVGLRNRTDIDTLQLQAQTLFFDEAGEVLYMEVGQPAPWSAVTISPNQTYYYKATSLRDEAVKFTIRVRYAKGAK